MAVDERTSSGLLSQTVCVTGTIYDSFDDSNPKYYPACWPSWTGGNWAATRTVPVEISTSVSSTSTTPSPSSSSTVTTTSSPTVAPPGNGGLSAGEKAGISIGAIVGFVAAVGLGIWIARRWFVGAGNAAHELPELNQNRN
ncbi:hypothetical protein EJ04DRAFT_511762 [Polyplosphaeria fusca]|uniref:Uncharacterized protein n=1 Tax=Polyplosphaeria fusca TaxID=682080 RepID=A0A9P4V0J0_9PLEO|nr:hypothetical protein EJ04DRAFT_511762 [Polyplosphaeria fusca]